MTQTKFISLYPIFVVFLFSSCVGGHQNAEIIPGGISLLENPATDEIKQLIEDIQPQIQTHFVGLPGANNILTEFRPISFRTQLVNGVNYFVKVGARTPNKMVYYHLRIYKSFGGEPELKKVVGPKRKHDSIGYF